MHYGATHISDFQHNDEATCPIIQAPSLCRYLEKPFDIPFSLNMPRNDQWSKVLFFDDDQVYLYKSNRTNTSRR